MTGCKVPEGGQAVRIYVPWYRDEMLEVSNSSPSDVFVHNIQKMRSDEKLLSKYECVALNRNYVNEDSK
jgi:hypothetical protein